MIEVPIFSSFGNTFGQSSVLSQSIYCGTLLLDINAWSLLEECEMTVKAFVFDSGVYQFVIVHVHSGKMASQSGEFENVNITCGENFFTQFRV